MFFSHSKQNRQQAWKLCDPQLNKSVWICLLVINKRRREWESGKRERKQKYTKLYLSDSTQKHNGTVDYIRCFLLLYFFLTFIRIHIHSVDVWLCDNLFFLRGSGIRIFIRWIFIRNSQMEVNVRFDERAVC